MIHRKNELGSGLTTATLSRSIREECERVHPAFLSRRSLDSWSLTVIGQQAPVVTATSNAPDGQSATEHITLTLSFGEDLMSFLEGQYAQWQARS
jgi:hypothetical protein